MKQLIFLVLLTTSIFSYGATTNKKVTPKEALNRLTEGNLRFAKDQMTHPDRSIERRISVSDSQDPYAIIVCCSDSRVSPEVLYDVGIGDLFVIRVAGNVIGPIEQESLDFAVEHLNPALIVVLGHENCGAVKAVLSDNTDKIKEIAALIKPSLSDKSESVEKAIKENVNYIVKQLKNNSSIVKRMKKREIGVVGCYYDFDHSKVEMLSGL